MLKRIIAIGLIYGLACVAWVTLGGSMYTRSHEYNLSIKDQVRGLWGTAQVQSEPSVIFHWTTTKEVTEAQYIPAINKTKMVKKIVPVPHSKALPISSSDIHSDFDLEHRKKGLLWYSTYTVDFTGNYSYEHREKMAGWIEINFAFPTSNATYDDFQFTASGDPVEFEMENENSSDSLYRRYVQVKPGQKIDFDIHYRTRGLDDWRYRFTGGIGQITNFNLVMNTDFSAIDFPDRSMSPTDKKETDKGWELNWNFKSLVSGFDIGLIMPQKTNPGPLAAQISFFAPISLLFFFAWMFVISVLKKIDLHPMNYLFLAAAFFCFHLLFSYTVDRIDLVPAFLISSTVSVFLVVSYLRLAVGFRFAAVEAGISQLVYLVLFSYAHFYKGSTGLMVTIGSILTLFVIMQLTGRIDWSEVFRSSKAKEKEKIPTARPVNE